MLLYTSASTYGGNTFMKMTNKHLVLLGVSILMYGCAIPGRDVIYSVDSDLGCMTSPCKPYEQPKVWIGYYPEKNQSFLNRLKYTWTCMNNYSWGEGWTDRPAVNQ